jgi:hypothetical protein
MGNFAKYKVGESPYRPAIKKDGHTMFSEDIVADLNRKSFLEGNKLKLEECLKSVQYSIHLMEQAGAFENNLLDQKMVEGVLARIREVMTI